MKKRDIGFGLLILGVILALADEDIFTIMGIVSGAAGLWSVITGYKELEGEKKDSPLKESE